MPRSLSVAAAARVAMGRTAAFLCWRSYQPDHGSALMRSRFERLREIGSKSRVLPVSLEPGAAGGIESKQQLPLRRNPHIALHPGRRGYACASRLVELVQALNPKPAPAQRIVAAGELSALVSQGGVQPESGSRGEFRGCGRLPQRSAAAKVSQASSEPDSSPRRNQVTRCSAVPWVNASGTT